MGSQLFLGTVVPILGGIIAIVMYCSPLKAAYLARQSQSLGELNPVPFAVTFMSTACWNAYGLAAPDYNMFLPNIPGFIAALYTSITCYALASKKVQNIMMSVMCSASFVVLLLAVMTRFVCNAVQGKLLWGYTCNVITILYYGAPLSSALAVVHTKDSSCIYLPTCIANLVNAALWVAYGFAVADPFIWVPNGVGGMFAVVLVVLCLIFPRKEKTKATTPSALVPKVKLTCDSEEHLLLDHHALEEGGIRGYTPADVSSASSGCGQALAPLRGDHQHQQQAGQAAVRAGSTEQGRQR